MKKLALIGPPGSGKSSIATAWAGDGLKVSFAAALRFEVANAFATARNTCQAILDEMQEPGKKARWRAILQHWGTLRRELEGDDYWLRPVRAQIERAENRLIERVAVDDCRFPNEYEMLRSKGFVFVRLEPKDDTRRGITAQESKHISEKHWPTFDIDFVLSYEEGPEHQAERLGNLEDIH